MCLLLLAAGGLLAAEPAEVVQVVDGDTLRVRVADRIESVRLIGIDAPERGARGREREVFARESSRFLRELAGGRRVRLETDPDADTRDRYGRLLRYVYLPDGRLLNAELVAGGYAHAYTRYPFSRAAEFRELEARARESGAGLWSVALPEPIEATDAAAHVGRPATVCGRVASTRYLPELRGRPTFLNFDRPHPDQTFTVVIWGSDRAAFDRPERRYADRRVCVEGWIRSYRGKPEMVVAHPSQVEVVDSGGGGTGD